MGFSIYLEVDNGEMYRIIRPDGVYAGDDLLSFENIFSDYASKFERHSEEYEWFRRLEERSRTDISLIGKISYSGEWNYTEDEYERFVRNHSDKRDIISEADFRTTISTLEKMWTPIDTLLTIVVEIIGILPSMGESTYWYSPKDTIFGFIGLFNTLVQAKERGGQDVRIKIV